MSRKARLIVTIDGPAGAGKSSVSRDLAQRLGLDFLDTGAMYRATAALALDRGVPLDEGPALARLLGAARLQFDWSSSPPELLAFSTSIMHRLRASDVDATVSPVSQLPEVRRLLVQAQRRIGAEHPRLVTEGRDQGSVVFPEADVKIFLSADPAARARRRAEQIGVADDAGAVRAIETELIERDRRDSGRAVGPLIRPAGAVDLDTTNMDQDGVVARLVRIVCDAAPHLLCDQPGEAGP